MPERPLSSKEKPAAVETKGALSDVDQLIADAEIAAAEAQRAAASEETKIVQTKKQSSAEAAERAEKLQQGFAALKAEDAYVEDYGFEWVLSASEAETAIAAPEKIREAIDAMRKSGEALKKIASVEPKTEALLQKMEALQKLHDKLFDQVQAATVDALDAVKKKYKGEETEFEKRYKKMSESPLVRGIEYDPNSPEAREKALKQEITEVIMRPLIETRLRPLETEIADLKGRIVQFREKNDRGYENLVQKIKALETQLARERLAFEFNRVVVEHSIKDEHNETSLREGLVGLRTCLGGLCENARYARVNRAAWQRDMPIPTSGLAQKILNNYEQYGVSMPEYALRDIPLDNGKLSPAEQLVGGKEIISVRYTNDINAAHYLGRESRLNLLRSRLTGINDDVINRLLPRNEEDINPETLQRNYKELVNAEARAKDKDTKVAVFLKEFPTVDAFVSRIFAEQGRLLNLRRVYEKVDAGLRGEKKPITAALPEALVIAGWKESKLGAFVEPGQSAREVDREYARLLEQFSQPQIDAERAFDARGHEGEFHVYTTEQAMALLRRARRDARDIVRDSGRALDEMKTRIEGDKKGKEGLEARVQRINDQLNTERKAADARIKDIEEQRDGALSQLQQETDSGSRSELGKRQLQKTLDDTLKQLQNGLSTKPGLFGGEKELRATVEDIVRKLEGK